MFKKYPHLERFGADEVQDIDQGICYIFPKIDGTNASLWMEDGVLKAGSRNRELALDDDNAGFFEAVSKDERYLNFFKDNPNIRLFGEWLVPHSLKTYRPDAWKKFYIFDAAGMNADADNFSFIDYDIYKPFLDVHKLDYIPALCTVTNPRLETLQNLLEENIFLIEDGKGFGEGIVIKNYRYANKFGRQTWAKIIRNEFKDVHAKSFNLTTIEQQKLHEEEIAKEFVTTSLVTKTYSKILTEREGWQSKYIPQLLNTVFYELIREETWNFIKKHNFPRLDFKLLKRCTETQTKALLPSVF